jgi:hypothetical protein
VNTFFVHQDDSQVSLDNHQRDGTPQVSSKENEHLTNEFNEEEVKNGSFTNGIEQIPALMASHLNLI